MIRWRIRNILAAIRRMKQNRGASAVEFALLAPVFIGCVLLLIEGGRMSWTQEALDEVVASTARCMAVDAARCSDAASARAFAGKRGSSWGIGLANATITVASNQTCNAVTGMNKISIKLPFQSSLGSLLPGVPNSIVAVACYPSIA